MYRKLRRVLVIATAAALAAACAGSGGGTSTGSATAPDTTTSPPAASGPPAAGPSTPASTAAPAVEVPRQLRFTATTVDGVAFEGASLAGKDAVVWFWAPWCGECRREAPHVAAVQAATKDKVVFVGASGLGEVPAMRQFVSQSKVGGFPHLADTTGSIWKGFGVTQQPAYAFIDNSGRVEVVRGELGEKRLAAKVAELTAR